MMAKTFALLSVVLLLGTGCAPKVRFDVPEGWRIRRTVGANEGVSSNVMAPSGGMTAWIIVVCGPLKDSTAGQEFLKIKESLQEEGAQIISTFSDPQRDYMVVTFAIETEDGQMQGKALVKLDSAGHKRLLNIQGIWPAEQDDDFVRIFDAVSASADFR